MFLGVVLGDLVAEFFGTDLDVAVGLFLVDGAEQRVAEQIAADCGIDVGGGRVPDLTVWAKSMPPRRARSSYAGTSGLLLAVEVVSSGSEIVDRITKKAEYAKAGIPRYWIVERDGGATVNRHVLNESAEYESDPAGPQPLAWLLASAPDIE